MMTRVEGTSYVSAAKGSMQTSFSRFSRKTKNHDRPETSRIEYIMPFNHLINLIHLFIRQSTYYIYDNYSSIARMLSGINCLSTGAWPPFWAFPTEMCIQANLRLCDLLWTSDKPVET